MDPSVNVHYANIQKELEGNASSQEMTLTAQGQGADIMQSVQIDALTQAFDLHKIGWSSISMPPGYDFQNGRIFARGQIFSGGSLEKLESQQEKIMAEIDQLTDSSPQAQALGRLKKLIEELIKMQTELMAALGKIHEFKQA